MIIPDKNKFLKEFLIKMIMIRLVEEKFLELYSEGLLSGTVHTCIGQEACAVGLISALNTKRDVVFSNHRGHGHYLAYTGDIRGLIAEVMGHPDGVCRGLGGSQHIQRDNFYTNGIQGASTPIVVGMALAEKIKNSGAVCVVNLGDGTFGEGAVYESMNIASLWNIPVIFSVENNLYAQTTPSKLQHSGDLSKRGASFEINIHKADGMDILDVERAAKAAVNDAKKKNRPQILFMDTYRFSPHSKGDDFRDFEEIQHHRKKDPIEKAASMLEISIDELNILKNKQNNIINKIVTELRTK